MIDRTQPLRRMLTSPRTQVFLFVGAALATVIGSAVLAAHYVATGGGTPWTAALAILVPAGVSAAGYLMVRSARPQAAAAQPKGSVHPAGPVHGDPSMSYNTSLDQALGAAHMRDLRAQVDLLCTMATVERMGPVLTQQLRNSGAATLAHQAASAAQLVRHILGTPNLAAQLQANRIRFNNPAMEELQGDLKAISVALARLGDELRGDESTVPPLWKPSVDRAELIANLEPVDQLLIQSTMLLSAVSDLARILATNYAQAKEAMNRIYPAGTGEDGHPTEGEGNDVPAWKLN